MGTHENRLVDTVLTSIHNLCFQLHVYQNFSAENFHFFFSLVVKFSVYLNRHVFVMVSNLRFVSRQISCSAVLSMKNNYNLGACLQSKTYPGMHTLRMWFTSTVSGSSHSGSWIRANVSRILHVRHACISTLQSCP